MLAATPNRDSSLELVRLTLKLISAVGADSVPTHLKEYFERVLSEAKALDHDPNSVNASELLPESIELALKMSMSEEFSSQVTTITNLNDVPPQIAETLLKKMETDFVYKDQFASAS